VVLEFESIRFPRLSPGKEGSPVMRGTNGGGVLDAVAEGGFEARAFGRLVESLAGEIRTADDGAGSRVRLVVPMCPPFDSELDFVASINGLREAAMLSGKMVTILKCRVGGVERSGLFYSQADLEFFEKCMSALSDGDALVRSRNPGSYYLVLIERRDDEIQHIVEFLGRPPAGNEGGPVAIEVLRSLSPESGLGEDLLVDLETVV
jgi:hypothetical protein